MSSLPDSTPESVQDEKPQGKWFRRLTFGLWPQHRKVVIGIYGLILLLMVINSGSGESGPETVNAADKKEPTAKVQQETREEDAPQVESPEERAQAEAAEAAKAKKEAAKAKKEAVAQKESEWLMSMTVWTSSYSEKLGTVGEVFSDSSTLQLAMMGDQDSVIVVASALVGLESCAATLDSEVGLAPTPRLRRIYRQVAVACSHYGKASRLATKGLDNVDPNSLNQATTELTRGNAMIAQATRGFEALQ